jgi:hypothetical protein
LLQFLGPEKRFHTAWVIRDGLVGCQSLPVFPEHRT